MTVTIHLNPYQDISVSQGETMKKCGLQYLIIVQDIVYLES